MTIDKDSGIGSVGPWRMENNGTTTAKGTKQMVGVSDDSETKEEENIQEDNVMEDSYDKMHQWMTNFRDEMTTLITTMTTNIMTKLEEVLKAVL